MKTLFTIASWQKLLLSWLLTLVVGVTQGAAYLPTELPTPEASESAELPQGTQQDDQEEEEAITTVSAADEGLVAHAQLSLDSPEVIHEELSLCEKQAFGEAKIHFPGESRYFRILFRQYISPNAP